MIVEDVDAGLDADLVEHGEQRLDGGVARAGAEAAGGAVDLLGAGPDGQDRVGHPEREVLVAVEADLGVVTELGHQGRDPVG